MDVLYRVNRENVIRSTDEWLLLINVYDDITTIHLHGTTTTSTSGISRQGRLRAGN